MYTKIYITITIMYRIKFKIALLVYKCINNHAPSYLSSMISLREISNHGVRRDNDYLLLSRPATPRLKSGHGAFSVNAPKVWNALPYSLRSISSIDAFKRDLKTYLFSTAFP